MQNVSEGASFCGGSSYKLLYVSGPLGNNASLNSYSITEVSNGIWQVSGRMSKKVYTGSHKFILSGINGQFDSSPQARGDKGLFNSVLSQPIEIKIVDPCPTAQLNPNRALSIPSNLNVPPGEMQVTRNLIGTKDSVSVAYGNGFDLCGEREYTVLQADGTKY